MRLVLAAAAAVLPIAKLPAFALLTRFAVLVPFVALASCGFVYDETLVGRYRLVGIDSSEDIMLCWSLSNGSCVGDGLPADTVVAAGFNNNYVVAAVDEGNGPPASKKATKFYYVIRAFENPNSDDGLPYRGIKGPFTRDEYAAEKVRLRLPDFSWHFEDR